MARPQTKQDLILAGNEQFKKLWDIVSSMSEEQQNAGFNFSSEMVKESHNKVIKLIETFSSDELFSKGVFDWVGGSTLGQYCLSTTSSHYDWAMKKLKAHLKTYKAK